MFCARVVLAYVMRPSWPLSSPPGLKLVSVAHDTDQAIFKAWGLLKSGQTDFMETELVVV